MVTRPLIKADRSSHRRRRTPGSFASVMATPCTFCLIFVASLYLLAFASAQTPIRIGRTVSNCGLFQKESQYIQDGLDFWLADVNARGGLLISDGTRRPVELITYSDGSDDAVVEILYDWLINQDKVLIPNDYPISSRVPDQIFNTRWSFLLVLCLQSLLLLQ